MFELSEVKIQGKDYPFKLNSKLVLRSSSYMKILEKLSNEVKSNPKGIEYYQVFDKKNGDLKEIYSPSGILMYRYSMLTEIIPFLGNDNPKFKVGEIVEVRCYDQLKLGVILATPVTSEDITSRKWELTHMDEVYLVDFSKDTGEHEHPFEHAISLPRFPVSAKKESELKEAFEYIKNLEQVKLAEK